MSKKEAIKVDFVVGKDDVIVEEKKDTIVVKVKDENLFLEQAKENGFTKEEIKRLDDFRQEFLKKAMEVTSNIAIDILPDYDNVKKMEMHFPYGARKKDSLKTFVITDAKVPVGNGSSERKDAVLIKAKAQFEATKVSSSFVKSLREKLEAKFLSE